MISAGSAFAPGVGGMVRYYEGLLGGLATLPEVRRIVTFVPPWTGRLGVPEHAKIGLVRCRGLQRNRAARVAYEQLVIPVLASLHRVDVLLCTTNVASLVSRRPTVVVLQSLQYFELPQNFARVRRAYLQWVVPRSLQRANRVIAVSSRVREDVLRHVTLDPEKIATVYHGAPSWSGLDSDREAPRQPYELADGSPFVLMVSRLDHHKNHRRLIAAFGQVVRQFNPPHHLVIVGADGDLTRTSLEAFAASEGLSGRVHCLGVVASEEIPRLYAGASAAAYVSLYETFGHPVLEAFTFGLPLVTSTTGSTAEIADSAARLVDPYSVDSIADGLRDVLLDDAMRRQLGSAGRERVREFTWDRCARETLAVLKVACGAAGPPHQGSAVESATAH